LQFRAGNEMDLTGLNAPQREAVTTLHGPLLVLSGAGSGKTRVITYKVASLIFDHGVSPYRIMALTFTNKAAREMADRIERLIRLPVRGLLVGTFHSICARLLRIEKVMGGNFTIYDTDDQKKIIKGVLDDLNLSDSRSFSPGDVAGRISGLKNRLITPERFDLQIGNVFDEQFASIYRRYEMKKRKSNGMDFDDLLIEALEMITKNDLLRDKYQEKVQYLLVDEYQDTNRVQYELVRQLSNKHRNITVVGDDDQSIYSWRGADLRNILEFEKAFPDAKTVRLEQNYRSTATILDAANAVISRNKARKPKTLWTEGERGDKLEVHYLYNDLEEAREVTRRIRTRGPKSTVIFYRTNAQSRTLEDELRNAGIPYVIVGGLRFYERKEIKDVLAYLRLLVNPADEVSLARIINLPKRGIGDKAYASLCEFAARLQIGPFEALSRLEEALEFTARERTAFSVFHNLCLALSAQRQETDLVSFVQFVAEQSGYLKYLEESEEEQAGERLDNVSEFINAVGEYVERNDSPTLESFLQEVALLTDMDAVKNDTGEQVTLMTLHAGKGLEFDYVFITGMEDGLFPISRAEEEGGLEEERRLFYVGITRARKWAMLTHAATRRRFGTTTSAFPSPFLDELPEHCIRRIDRTGGSTSFALRDKPAAAPLFNEVRENRQAMPSYEHFSQEDGLLRNGMKVQHPIWGKGTVVMVSGLADNMKATIKFQNDAVKKVMVKYAKLEIVGG